MADCSICLDTTKSNTVLWQCCSQSTCAECALTICQTLNTCPFCRRVSPSLWHPVRLDDKSHKHTPFLTISWTNHCTLAPHFIFMRMSATVAELCAQIEKRMGDTRCRFVYAGRAYDSSSPDNIRQVFSLADSCAWYVVDIQLSWS